MKEKIIIIDGNSLVNRAFYAMPASLKALDGTPINGVFGFLRMLNKVINDYKPTYISVAFDMKGPTFRHKQYDDYKGTRAGMPDDLAVQMPILKEMLDLLQIHRMELQGYEADDLIGTVAKNCSANGIEVVIITGDKDALQLVDDNISVHITKKGISEIVPYTDDLVFEEFGISPHQIIDFKGLSGDTSDNIPGIPKVGPKTATKLLQQLKTVEDVIERSDEIDNKRLRGLVEEYAEQAILSKQLATIMIDVPVEINMEAMKLGAPDPVALEEGFMRYNFKNLINDFMPKEADGTVTIAGEAVDADFEMKTATALSDIDDLYKLCADTGKVVYHLLYDKDNVRRMEPLYGFFTCCGKKGLAVPFREIEGGLQALKALFEDEFIKKDGYETKRDYIVLRNAGIALNGLEFDGYIASYLVHPDWKNYSVADAVAEYFNKRILTREDLLGKGVKEKRFDETDRGAVLAYGKTHIKSIYDMTEILVKRLAEEGLEKLYKEIEMPLIEVLADIEYDGFNVDTAVLETLDSELVEKIDSLEKEIYHFTKEPFNIKSPKQLGVVLFEELALPTDKKTKTGYSTSHDVLLKLRSKHPIIDLIIEYRAYTKLKSTYIDGLLAVINPDTGRIHTSLNQTVAVTGRLSSTEPNLQNIPIRLPLGREIRKIFVPSEGCQLVDADYSQIELRILAHMSEDENLKRAFIEKIDVHAMTASQVFDLPLEQVTSLERSRAKEVNFGIVYGMSDYGLSENLNITRAEAKKYIEQYFEKYSSVKRFMDDTIEQCRKEGYVTTLFDRKRNIPEINHKNFNLRSFAERTAMNTPIQGTAADIMKIAMIKVHQELKAGHYKSRLILQVHDELIVDTVADELEAVKKIVEHNMEEAVKLSVPLKVDLNVGASWYDTK
ncbi:MAG: DNA polymerase I [Clostridia bacterium]|nr:DNA polymerase I [Clostridia bacterium]